MPAPTPHTRNRHAFPFFPRKKVIAALSALHECGVAHNAFNEAAVVLRPSDNAPILVGFGSADPAHTCRCSREHLCFYEPQPHVDAVACE